MTGEKFRDIAKALGVANTESMSQKKHRIIIKESMCLLLVCKVK